MLVRNLESVSIIGYEKHNTMNVVYSLCLLQHVSAALYGRHQVVLQTHKKEVCFLGRGLPFTNSEYSMLVTCL